MTLVGAGFVVLTLALVAVLAVSLGAWARRAGLERAVVTRLSGGAALVLAVWLAAMLVLAQAGVFQQFTRLPPRIPLAALTPLLAVVLLARTRTFARLLDVMPVWWPIAIQVFRIPVELLLWALYQRGALPVHMTFEGRNLDVLVGITAPFVAYAVYRGWLGRAGIIAWNVASLGLLVNIVAMAVTSLPGPLHRPWEGVAPVVVTQPPFIWLPSFLVPLAAIGHVLSLRSERRPA